MAPNQETNLVVPEVPCDGVQIREPLLSSIGIWNNEVAKWRQDRYSVQGA